MTQWLSLTVFFLEGTCFGTAVRQLGTLIQEGNKYNELLNIWEDKKNRF